MEPLSQLHVSIIDWIIVGLCGLVFVVCTAGGIYVASYGGSTTRHAGAGFNYLWQSRLCFQLVCATYALAHLLRLQVLWGPESVFGRGPSESRGWQPTALCRAYLAVEYGLLEPAGLLLALFTCFYSIKSKLAPPVTGGVTWSVPSGVAAGAQSPAMTSKPGIAHPNFNIVFFALGFTLPCSTAQLITALLTRILGEDQDEVPIYHLMFSTFETDDGHCPADKPPLSCAWCVFPLLSTLISAAFLIAFLVALSVITRHILRAAISRPLVTRVKVLQIIVSCTLLGSVACRAVTVLFKPFDLGFELLRLGDILLYFAAIITLSYFLAWKPVRDAQVAEREVHLLTLKIDEINNGLPIEPAVSTDDVVSLKHIEVLDPMSSPPNAAGAYWRQSEVDVGNLASSKDEVSVRVVSVPKSTATPVKSTPGVPGSEVYKRATRSSSSGGITEGATPTPNKNVVTASTRHDRTTISSLGGANPVRMSSGDQCDASNLTLSSAKVAESERQPLFGDAR